MLKHSLLFIFLLITLLVISQVEIAQQTFVASVNGEPIGVREYDIVAQKYKSIVIQEFRSKYALPFNDNFWQTSIKGQTPNEVLRKRTINELINIKIQQLLAKKNGLVEDISYVGFLKKLNIENQSRAEALRTKKVIFGPTQYAETVYYDYLFSNLVIQLKKVLLERQFNISDENLHTLYEKQKDNKFRLEDFIRLRETKVKCKSKRGNVKDFLSKNINRLQLLVKDTVYESKWEVSTQEIIFNHENQSSEDNDYNQSVLQLVQHLSVGEKASIFEAPNFYKQYLVLERKPLGYRAFDSCRNYLKSAYLDSCYESEIKNFRKSAIIVQY